MQNGLQIFLAPNPHSELLFSYITPRSLMKIKFTFFTLFCATILTAADIIDDSGEHYRLGIEAINTENWNEALNEFNHLVVNYPETYYGQEAYYYLGVINYNFEEYDMANNHFSNYLKSQTNPRFFQSALEYKYQIAENFHKGAKRHFLGTKYLPKWATGKTIALGIYDEVSSAMPSSDLAASALYSKGCLQWTLRDYRDSIDSFQLVIRRFPKHELTPECYLNITKIYLEQCQIEVQNSDILPLAEINIKRFKEDFPREERISESENDILQIKEIYAKGLFDTASFYEKIQYPKASILYYRKALTEFPETSIAQQCKERLSKLSPDA